MNGRERVLSHLAGKEVDHLPLMPITMMLAAEQIGVRYLDYATDFRVLAEAQIKTAETFGFDYVNTMSDPAREAADCGAAVEYFDNQPPALIEEKALLADKKNLGRLSPAQSGDGRRMANGVSAVALLKEKIGRDKLVEGWIEGPCAEGADLRGINTLMLDFYDDPDFVHDLFQWAVALELGFARAQIEAGADLIGVGDAAASLVGPEIYRRFVFPYEKQLVDGLHALGVPVRLHICGNTRFILEEIGRLGCEIVDLDFLTPLREARQKMGPGQILLGNIDPVRIVRDGSPSQVRNALAQCHAEAGQRYIVGAGCEIPRGTPPENVHALAEYASCLLGK